MLKKNLFTAKALLRKSTSINMDKDVEIKMLTSKKNREMKSDHLFEEFSSNFDKKELTTIRSVLPGQKNDSRFILNIMRFLYKGDERAKLQNRSAAGRKHNGEKKAELSFEKKSILKTMFEQRVNDECPESIESIDTKEHSNRIKNLNKLIRSAIHNIMTAVKKEAHGKRGRDEETDVVRHSKLARTNESMYEKQIYIYRPYWSHWFILIRKVFSMRRSTN